MENVEPNGSCWEWVRGYVSDDGYGKIWHNGMWRNAHRVVFELTVGLKDPGSDVDHQCRNRLCVNPGHMIEATRKMNSENQSIVSTRCSTGYRGVYKMPSGRFAIRVGHNRSTVNGGTFDTIEEAVVEITKLRAALYTNAVQDVAYIKNGGES